MKEVAFVALLSLGLVALGFSGAAVADHNLPVDTFLGDKCNGTIDYHCTCKRGQGNCEKGEFCTVYVGPPQDKCRVG